MLIEGVIGIGRFGRREGTDQRSFLGIYRVGIGNGFFVGRRSFYGRLGGQGKNIPAVLREPFFARFVVGIRFSVRVRDRVVFLVVFVSEGKHRHFFFLFVIGIAFALGAVEKRADHRVGIVQRIGRVHDGGKRHFIEHFVGVLGEVAHGGRGCASQHGYIALVVFDGAPFAVHRIIDALFAVAEQHQNLVAVVTLHENARFIEHFAHLHRVEGVREKFAHSAQRRGNEHVRIHSHPVFRNLFYNALRRLAHFRGKFFQRGKAGRLILEIGGERAEVFHQLGDRLLGVFLGDIFGVIDVGARDFIDGFEALRNLYLGV